MDQTLLFRLNTVTPESQRLWGQMSVGQMLTHCTDQVQIVLGEKQGKPFGTAPLRWLAKWIALTIPLPLPKNLRTIPELDPNRALMTQPTDFSSDRNNLLAALSRLSNVPDNHPFNHPVFGRITKAEALKLTGIHLDHHLRQFSA